MKRYTSLAELMQVFAWRTPPGCHATAGAWRHDFILSSGTSPGACRRLPGRLLLESIAVRDVSTEHCSRVNRNERTQQKKSRTNKQPQTHDNTTAARMPQSGSTGASRLRGWPWQSAFGAVLHRQHRAGFHICSAGITASSHIPATGTWGSSCPRPLPACMSGNVQRKISRAQP